MRRNKYKRKDRRKSKKTGKIILVLVMCAIAGICGTRAYTYLGEQKKIKLEQERIAEEKRIQEERIRREEEEKKKYVVGVSHEGKKDSYDASIVADKINKYDYSNNGEKVVFLTFDDGASTTVTPEVLKVLRDEGVKATFFLTGKSIERGGEEARKLVKQEFEEGHAIANHSYSHDYNSLYPNRTLNLDTFIADFKKTDEILTDILGKYFSTRVIRCPGGYMSWKGMDKLDQYLLENNMVSIDWNALNADSEGRKKNSQQLAEYAIETSKGKEMVVLLMHDTYGKEETAKALPEIIRYFKDNGYKFKTLS